MSTSQYSRDLWRPRFRRRALLIGVAFATFFLIFGNVGTVSAHTGFESSDPSEGTTVDQPVGVITISFTGEATPVGDEFVALTPGGELQQSVAVETVDDKVFTIRFDPPLAGGQIGIRWRVQAADAHPIEGAFTFTVNTPTPTIPPATPPTTVVAAAASATTPAALDGQPAPSDTTPGVVADDPTAEPALSLEEFLTVDHTVPGETTALMGRVIGFVGVTLGLGGLAFVATAMRGRRQEIHAALTTVRVWGGVIAVGAAIEYIGVARIADKSLTSAWSTAPGFATTIRILGGIGLAVGLAGTITRGRVQRLMRRPSAVRSLSAAVADDARDQQDPNTEQAAILRWTPDRGTWPAVVGSALIIVSFWFDGHTVSKGFRPLHALVNSVHVAAGAVWVGGLVAMAVLIWSRHRAGHPMRAVELVVRFSKLATVSLAAVVAAGAIMAFLVLDSFAELTGTEWGKILLLKTGAVVLAMIGGAYNHFRLLPALEADPESPALLEELRSTVTAEAIMLVFVVIVTAWLVAAAT